MVIERNLVKVGNQEVKKRYIGNKLIFEDLGDKTDILSGTEIFTDQADDSIVHVEIDGKSYQEDEPSPDNPSEIHSLNDFDVVSSVGRRNLASKNGWIAGGANPVETENGFIITRPEGGNSSDVRIIGRDLDIKEENDYTLSFKVRKLDGELLRIGGHVLPNFIANGNIHINGEELSERFTHAPIYEPLNNGEWHEVVAPLRTGESISDTASLYIQPNRSSYRYSVVEIKDIKFEEGHLATPYTPSLEEVEDDNHPLIDKINISLSEPLRSVGDVKDRLFRDNDGLWKVERNVHILGVEILSQEMQDKLNNLRSFQGSNYVYTIINDKTDILSDYVAENLQPTLHTTFKSKGWYDYYLKTLLK